MANQPVWRPVTTVGMPALSGIAVTNSLANMGRGFNEILDRAQARREAEADEAYRQEKLGMEREKLDFDLGAPEREIDQQRKLFNLKQEQAKAVGADLAGINEQLGGSLFDQRVANANFDERFKNVEEYQRLSPEQKAAFKESAFAALKENRRLISDPTRVGADARRLYMEQGITDPDQIRKHQEMEYESIFGKSLDKDIAKSLLPSRGASSTTQDKMLLEMYKNQGKLLDQGDWRQTDKYINEWMDETMNLGESRMTIFGIRELPDIGQQKAYKSDIRKLVQQGIAKGIPPSGTLSALSGMIKDKHFITGFDPENMVEDETERGQQVSAFWATADQAARAQGRGATGDVMNYLGSGGGGGGRAQMPLSDIIAATAPTAATDEDMTNFYLGQLSRFTGNQIMPPAAAAAPAPGANPPPPPPVVDQGQGGGPGGAAEPAPKKLFAKPQKIQIPDSQPEAKAALNRQVNQIWGTVNYQLKNHDPMVINPEYIQLLRATDKWDEIPEKKQKTLLEVLQRQ